MGLLKLSYPYFWLHFDQIRKKSLKFDTRSIHLARSRSTLNFVARRRSLKARRANITKIVTFWPLKTKILLNYFRSFPEKKIQTDFVAVLRKNLDFSFACLAMLGLCLGSFKCSVYACTRYGIVKIKV